MASGDEIYSNLNTKKLSDVSATDIDTLTEPLHIQKSNEDALRTTVLINKASMRDGSSIPGTSQISTTTVTDNTRTVLFTPGPGEVWVLNAAGAYTVNASSATYSLWVTNTPTGGSDILGFLYDDTDDTNVIFTDDANFQSFYHFDENVDIQGTVGGSVDSSKWMLHLYRIR